MWMDFPNEYHLTIPCNTGQVFLIFIIFKLLMFIALLRLGCKYI